MRLDYLFVYFYQVNCFVAYVFILFANTFLYICRTFEKLVSPSTQKQKTKNTVFQYLNLICLP